MPDPWEEIFGIPGQAVGAPAPAAQGMNPVAALQGAGQWGVPEPPQQREPASEWERIFGTDMGVPMRPTMRAHQAATQFARDELDDVTWNLRSRDPDSVIMEYDTGEYSAYNIPGVGYGRVKGFEVTRSGEFGTGEEFLAEARNRAKAEILANDPSAKLDEGFDRAFDDRYRNVVLANKFLNAGEWGEGSSQVYLNLVGTMTPQQRKGFIHEVYKEQKSRQPLKRSKLGRVTQRAARGLRSLPEAFNYIKDSWGPWSDAERSEFRRDVIQLEEIRRGFDPATSDNMFMQGLLGAAEMAGPMLTGGMVAGKAGKAAAALGAGTKGVAFAAATGGTTFWTGLEGSHIHRAMIDEGVSKSSADMWALVGGAAIGSLEYLQYKLLLPGSMRGKLGEGIARSIPHSAIRAGARYEGEITVEMLQSVTGTVAEQVAQRLEGINTFDSKRELEEFKDEFREVALAMIFMTGPASVIEGVQDHMSRKTIAQIELYAEEMRAAEEKRVQDFAEANQDARDREDEKEEQFLLDRALAEQERGIAEREARAKDAAKEPSRQEYRDTIQRAADWEAMDVFTQREDETEGDLQKRVVSDILFETAVDADLEGQLNEFIKNPSRSKASAVILPDGTRLGSKLGGLGSREAFVREIQRQQGRAEVDRGPSELNIGDVVDIGEDDAAGRPEATGTVIAQRPGGNYDVELPSGEQLTVNAQQDVTFVHPSREQEVAPPQPVPQAEPSPVPTLEEMSRTELLDYAVDRAGMDSQYVARRLGFLSEPAIRRKISEVMEAPVAPPRVEGEGVPDIGREPPQEPTEAPVAPEPEVQPPAPPVTLEQVDRMTGKNLHNLITELGIKGVKGKKKAVLRKAIIDHLGLKAVAEAAEPVAPVVEAAREEEKEEPRIFYRGTTPGDARRIDEPFESAKGLTFAARRRGSARMYGPSIERIEAKPDAKILYQEDPGFWKLIGRRRPPSSNILAAIRKGETAVDVVNLAIDKAKAAGYDIISFSSDSDIGTVILNEDSVVRSPADTAEVTKPPPVEAVAEEAPTADEIFDRNWSVERLADEYEITKEETTEQGAVGVGHMSAEDRLNNARQFFRNGYEMGLAGETVSSADLPRPRAERDAFNEGLARGREAAAEVTKPPPVEAVAEAEEAPAPPAAAEIIGEAEEKPTEKPDKPDVAMEAMPDQEQAEKDLERRETRRKYRRTDEEAVKNAKKLAKEWVDEGGLEKEMRDELDVLEDDNPGIEDAMEGAIFDKENNRLISLDGLTGVVWENDGNVRGSFHVEHYGFNEKSATGQSTMDLFMRRAAQMSEADYEKDIRAGRRDELPSHRTILEALIATGKGDQVTDVAAEGHKDLKRPPTQASVLPVVMFDLGPVTGAIKRGLDWAKETVKAFWKKYLSSAGLIGKMGKAAYDRMIATVAADLNEARNRYEDFLRAVREANDGTPLHKLSPAKKLELFEALSDPVLRTTLDADVAAAVEAIREHIAIMSQRLIDADILTEEMELVFDENMQAYLHRSYQGADDPNWAKKVRKQPKVIARAKVVIQDRHRRRRRKKVTKKIKDDIKRRARDGEGSKLTTLEESQVDQELVDAVAEQQKWKPTKAERDAAIEKEVAENEEIKEAVAKGKIKTEAGKRRRAAKIVDNQIKQHRKARVRDTLSQGLDSVMVDQIVEENTTDLTDKELETEVEVLIRRIEKIGEGERGDATVRANHGILKHRKDIDEAIRSLYGEYKDVGTAYVKSINKMSNMLAKHEFLSALRVALPDDMLSETKTPETPEQLKGEEWGDINGWWVSRSFLAAEKDLFGKGGELPTWAKIWFNGVGHAKAAKTVMSMVTTIRNFVSNVSFAVINGHTGHKNWRQAMKYGWLHMQPDLASGKFDRTGPTHEMAREFVNKMVKLGVLGQSQAREMTSLIKEAWDAEFDAYVFGREEQAEELAGKVLRKLRQRGGKVYKGLGTIYQAMDEIPKMVGFISNREMLKEAFPDWTDAQLDEEAARRVSNQYPTWNKIPLGIRKLRVWPFQGTFVSFASELIRTTTMTMKQAKEDMNSGNARLKRHGQLVGVRMLGMSFGLKAAINSLVALGGFDDDDRDALDRHVAPWSRHSTKFMWRNSEGGIEHFDISFMFPHLALLDAFNAFDDEDVPLFRRAWDAMGELGGDAILGEDMVVQKAREAFTNSKREGGTIWYKSDTFAEKARKFSNHLLDPWKPGTYTSGRRIYRGWRGYTEQSGRSYSAPYEMLAMFTGARHSTVDLKQSMRFKAVRFKANLRDAKARISREAYSQRTGSDVAMKSKLAQSDAAIKGYYHDMYLDVQAAMKLGMNRRQVSGILRDNGFSEKDVKLIMRDRHAVQTWSDEQLRKIGKTTGGRNKRVSLRGRRRDSR